MRPPIILYFLLFLHLFLGIGALVGGLMMVLNPDGSLLGMQTGWLDQSPFDNYIVPGLILLILNGLFPLFTMAGLIFKPNWAWANVFNIYLNRHWSWTYSLYVGIIVVAWITFQLIMTQYFWLQPVIIFVGLLIVICTMIPEVIKFYETKQDVLWKE